MHRAWANAFTDFILQTIEILLSIMSIHFEDHLYKEESLAQTISVSRAIVWYIFDKNHGALPCTWVRCLSSSFSFLAT